MTPEERLILQSPIMHFTFIDRKERNKLNRAVKKRGDKSSVKIDGNDIEVRTVGEEFIKMQRELYKLYQWVREHPAYFDTSVIFRVKYADFTEDFTDFSRYISENTDNYKQCASFFFDFGTTIGKEYYGFRHQSYWCHKDASFWKKLAKYTDFQSYLSREESELDNWYLSSWRRRMEKLPERVAEEIYKKLYKNFMAGFSLGIKECIQRGDVKEVVKRFREYCKQLRQEAIEKTKQMIANPRYKAKYPPELRLKVVSEYRIYSKNKNCSTLAEKYNIPLGAVHSWVYAAYGYSD